MSPSRSKLEPADQVSDFFASMFGMSREEFKAISQWSELPPETTFPEPLAMPGVMALNNQPEFWADAPWRLEPDQTEVPITIYIRDANVDSPGYSPWRLNSLRIEQRLKNKRWLKLKTFLPVDLSNLNVDEQGQIKVNFWVFRTSIPKTAVQEVQTGETFHLRVVFEGSTDPYEKTVRIVRHLEVLLPAYPLPQGRVESADRPRRWFYGDTHYHSAYTNDIKEFGAPLPETRAVGLAVGLDWLVVTDHSCDLVRKDTDLGSGETRWERLKADISSPALSDERFRLIIGEEITLIGQDEKFVHMLAIGGMQDVIEGAFLPDDSSSLPVDLWIRAIKSIIHFGKGYPPDLSQSLFGKLYRFEEVLDRLPQATLTFAAHPYNIAQVPPSKWDKKDLAHLRLTGHEFWNGRCRRSVKLTDDPFGRKGWTDPGTLDRQDTARIKKLFQLARVEWEPHLMRGVEEWASGAPLPSRRPVFIGGSDSHGDFNYHAGMAWDYKKADMIDDNSPGRVRTAIFLPEHQAASVPEVDAILAALKKGSCVVTDGPVLEFSLQFNGQVASMGDALLVSGAGDPELKVTGHSTPEFGPVTQAEVVTYFKGQKPKVASVLAIERGKPAAIQLVGEQGYCRLQAQTVGLDGERFCCFTNPIWIRFSDPSKRAIQIQFS